MVPLRDMAEVLECQVAWLEDNEIRVLQGDNANLDCWGNDLYCQQ